MTTARNDLVDPTLTRWYHCVCRCVRRAPLLCQGTQDRKAWIESRVQELAEIFAISVGAFAVMDDRVHLLLRLDPAVAEAWSKEEVVRRYGRLQPPRAKTRETLAITDEWVRSRMRDAAWVATARARLHQLGWFMKSLKEPLSRLANREDRTRGAFFEGRFKSIAVLDVESLVASCAYIDLNPVFAGATTSPTASPYTSIRQRFQHVKAAGRLKDLKLTKSGAGGGQSWKALARLAESHWLCPIEKRQGQPASREGMMEGLTLGSYLLLLDYTAGIVMEAAPRKSPPPGVVSLLAQLGVEPEQWQQRLVTLSDGRLLGRFFAASRERLRDAAEQMGIQRLANLDGCATS